MTLDIYGLSGRLVRRVYEGVEANVAASGPWDGRDSAGVVRPGTYIYSIRVDADDRAG